MKREKPLWYSYGDLDKWISKYPEYSIYEHLKKGTLRYPYYSAPELKSLQDLISYCAETYGDKTAFHFLKKNIEIKKSYRAFFEDVASLCNYFIMNGYKRTHIALLGENSYEWLVSYFAIINSNNVVVPLDKEMAASELSSIIKRSDAVVLIHSADYEEEAEVNDNIRLINMDSLASIISQNKTEETTDINFFKYITIDNDAMCAIVYTSGTTSEPKGVMLSHKNIISDALFSQMHSLVPNTSILVLPLHHTYAITIAIALPMLYGASIFINKSLRTLMSDIAFCRPKYIAVVPLMLEIFCKKITDNLKGSGKENTVNKLLVISKILRLIGLDFRRTFFSKIIDVFGGKLELIAVGGAPINGKTVEALTDFGITVSGGYGTSECSPIVSFVRDKHYNPYSSGTILPNVQARIVENELQVKGDIVFLGYYKDEKATKQVFDGEWYKTGDIATFEDGFLFIKGRCKNVIALSNGENVSPESLELVLQDNIPEIDEVIVYNQEDTIIAEIYVSSDVLELKAKINNDIEKLNKTLPLYKQIDRVLFRDNEFEKTTTKKIKRKQQ